MSTATTGARAAAAQDPQTPAPPPPAGRRPVPWARLPGTALIWLFVAFCACLVTSFFAPVPGELEPAPPLDAVGAGMAFWRIMPPEARGGLVTALILVASACWNETFVALMFLQTNENFTLLLALVNFL